MAKYKITALTDVRVTAQIWFMGSVPMPRDHQGTRLPPMTLPRNREESFKLLKGQSKEDVAFLIGVTDRQEAPQPRNILLPDAIGARTQDGAMLLIERVE